MNSRSFSIDLAKAIEEAKDSAEQTVKDAVLTLVTNIVAKTPVDTSQLSKSWNTSLESIDLRLHTAQSEDSVSRAVKVMDKYNLKIKKIHISNNQPYAYDIEFKGKSRTKAPQGMLRLSIIEFDNIFKGSAMKVNKGAGSKQNRYK